MLPHIISRTHESYMGYICTFQGTPPGAFTITPLAVKVFPWNLIILFRFPSFVNIVLQVHYVLDLQNDFLCIFFKFCVMHNNLPDSFIEVT